MMTYAVMGITLERMKSVKSFLFILKFVRWAIYIVLPLWLLFFANGNNGTFFERIKENWLFTIYEAIEWNCRFLPVIFIEAQHYPV